MKKLISGLVLSLFIAASFTSCKKDDVTPCDSSMNKHINQKATDTKNRYQND